MPRYYARVDDFDLEISPQVERMVKHLQEVVPPDDIFLYFFVMIYTCDKLLSYIAEADPDFFNEMITEDSDIEQLASLVFSKLDFIYQQED